MILEEKFCRAIECPFITTILLLEVFITDKGIRWSRIEYILLIRSCSVITLTNTCTFTGRSWRQNGICVRFMHKERLIIEPFIDFKNDISVTECLDSPFLKIILTSWAGLQTIIWASSAQVDFKQNNRWIKLIQSWKSFPSEVQMATLQFLAGCMNSVSVSVAEALTQPSTWIKVSPMWQ